MNEFAIGTKLLIEIVSAVDAAGAPATLKSVPVWTTSDSTILALSAASDGLSATGITALPGGVTSSITITATAGPEDNGISASATITVDANVPPPPNPVASFQLQVTPQ